MAKTVRSFESFNQWRDWEKVDARIKAKAIKARDKRRARYERSQAVLEGIKGKHPVKSD